MEERRICKRRSGQRKSIPSVIVGVGGRESKIVQLEKEVFQDHGHEAQKAKER